MWQHSFLMENSRWQIRGSWLERNQGMKAVRGTINIIWTEPTWFTMEILLLFPNTEDPQIKCQYRGHFYKEKGQYTYVLKQNLLGRVEGEGWLAPESIVQRYWAIGDTQKRTGFESFYRLNQTTYNFSSGIFTGYYLSSTMEAVIERLS